MIGNSRYSKIIAAVVVAVITGKILLDSGAAEIDIIADAGVSRQTISMVEEAYHILPSEIRTAIGKHGTGVRILENGDTISSAYRITNLNAVKDQNGLNVYVTRDPNEYYAESFYVLLTDPDTLREKQPRTYEYMKEDMERAVSGKYAATEHAK